MPYRVSRLCTEAAGRHPAKVYEVQRNTVLRPDPLLAKGITFQRHDPGWRLYHLPLQSRLTKGHSESIPNGARLSSIGTNLHSASV